MGCAPPRRLQSGRTCQEILAPLTYAEQSPKQEIQYPTLLLSSPTLPNATQLQDSAYSFFQLHPHLQTMDISAAQMTPRWLPCQEPRQRLVLITDAPTTPLLWPGRSTHTCPGTARRGGGGGRESSTGRAGSKAQRQKQRQPKHSTGSTQTHTRNNPQPSHILLSNNIASPPGSKDKAFAGGR